MGKSKANKCKCCNSAFGAVASHLIFDEAGKQQNIAILLFDYIGKRVVESDGDQQAVCDNCLRQLVQCYEFKRKCVQANVDDSEDDDGVDEVDEVDAVDEVDEVEEVEYLVVEVEDETDYTYAENAEESLAVESEDDDLIAANIEYLDVEVEDEPNYSDADAAEEAHAVESEIIELTEFALDTTSKTVKTIGKLSCVSIVIDLNRIDFPFWRRYRRRFAPNQGETETGCSTAHDRAESNDEIHRGKFGRGENPHLRRSDKYTRGGLPKRK